LNARRAGRAAPLRVAVVGLGAGRAHARALLGAPEEAVLCALCDADRRLLADTADELGVAARDTDWARLLAGERPDAVVVATENDRHEARILEALAAGADVLCERPLAHDLPAARRIAAAAKKSGRRLVMNFPFRCTGPARTARRFLVRGSCGPLYHASTYWARARGLPDAWSWRALRRRAGGGPVVDLGAHRLDLALWFLGEPMVERVTAFTHARLGRVLRGARCDVEDFGGGVLRCTGGVSVVFETSWAENSGRRDVSLTRALGVGGGAVHKNVDHSQKYVAELYRDRRGRLEDVDARRFAQPELAPAVEFVRKLAGRGAGVLPGVERGLALAEVVAAIYRSARERREVAVAELAAP
jgi:predicted dehydrogenase